MKCNAINMLRQGANRLREIKDSQHAGMYAYGIHELANNLPLVMQGKASLEDFQKTYTHEGSELIDLDRLFPATDGAEG